MLTVLKIERDGEYENHEIPGSSFTLSEGEHVELWSEGKCKMYRVNTAVKRFELDSNERFYEPVLIVYLGEC